MNCPFKPMDIVISLPAFDGMTSVFGFPYQFLAQNFGVSGGGIIEIPAFKTPLPSGSTKECLIAITIQNHSKDNFQFKTRSLIIFAALDSSFVSMNYTVASTDGSYSYKFPRNDSKPLYATGQSDVLYLKGSLSYKWTIDYDYNTAATQIIECRMYSSDYHDFLPLPDF
ncbi:hypothetical protein CRE_23787 [Caenorhabditis remanei]|uniref:DUF7154 domain-containing protein n=1 Tax=Caenorhabditis remanei TaxID=31234 RepID=E3NMN3_CAERE|nr:hypothetical protein CRE_23787 [Caenorhabditis remanei]